MKQRLQKKKEKEDLVRARKAVGQTKLSFAKKSKTIDYLLLNSDHRQSYCFSNSSQIEVTA